MREYRRDFQPTVARRSNACLRPHRSSALILKLGDRLPWVQRFQASVAVRAGQLGLFSRTFRDGGPLGGGGPPPGPRHAKMDHAFDARRMMGGTRPWPFRLRNREASAMIRRPVRCRTCAGPRRCRSSRLISHGFVIVELKVQCSLKKRRPRHQHAKSSLAGNNCPW